MTALWRVLRAFLMAAWAHRGQRDKSGHRYLGHVVRVAWLAYGLTGEVDAAIVGLLHDSLEDAAIESTVLLTRFGQRVWCAVLDLTRPPGMRYEAYIEHVLLHGSALAVQVKLADLLDNTNPTRLNRVYWARSTEYYRLLAKYVPTLERVATARAKQ